MKKIIGGLAALPLLALLTTSCNDETVEAKGGGPKELTFGVATGKQTLSRAAEVDIQFLWDDAGGLDVYSYFDDGTLFTGAPFNITYDAGAWSYGTPEYHPVDDLYHFSVYPEDAEGLGAITFDDTDASASFDYAVPNDLANQTDLMAAADVTENTEFGAAATLMYSHLLSQVNFAIVGIEGIEITVDNISVNGVKSAGTYTFGTGWGSSLSGSGTYPYLNTFETDPAAEADTVYNLRSNANALMLMPQAFVGGDGNFSFTYTMRNEYGDLLTGEDIEVSVDFGAVELTQYTDEWLPGKRYLYVINFEAPYVLSFDVEIEEGWSNYDNDEGVIEVDAEDHREP